MTKPKRKQLDLKAVKLKAVAFGDMVEKLKARRVSEPLIAGNYIAFTLTFDAVGVNQIG